jgi:hypothetical protein
LTFDLRMTAVGAKRTFANCQWRVSAKLRHDWDMASARARRAVAGYESAPGLSRAPLVQSPVGIGAKIARAAAGRRSSNIAIRQRRARRVNNRKSFSFSSEAFAGVRITHRHQKEAEPEASMPTSTCGVRFRTRRLRVPGKKIAMDQEQ